MIFFALLLAKVSAASNAWPYYFPWPYMYPQIQSPPQMPQQMPPQMPYPQYLPPNFFVPPAALFNCQPALPFCMGVDGRIVVNPPQIENLKGLIHDLNSICTPAAAEPTSSINAQSGESSSASSAGHLRKHPAKDCVCSKLTSTEAAPVALRAQLKFLTPVAGELDSLRNIVSGAVGGEEVNKVQSGVTNVQTKQDLFVSSSDSMGVFVHTYDKSQLEIVWYIKEGLVQGLEQLVNAVQALSSHQPELVYVGVDCEGGPVSIWDKLCK